MLEIKPIRDLTLTTTLVAIRETNPRPCEGGWAQLLGHLGKTRADDEPLPLTVILGSNGLDDTLWVLGKTTGLRRICVLFAADCAEQVLPLFERARPDDRRPRSAIEVARDPNASAGAAEAASAAANSAAWDAYDAAARHEARAPGRAAGQAASGAAGAVTSVSAWAAAWGAALAAASAAASAAARGAARAAALAAAMDAQRTIFQRLVDEAFCHVASTEAA